MSYTSSSSSLARVSSSLSLHWTCSALYAFRKFSSSLISAWRRSRCAARRFCSSFMGSGFISLKAMLVSFLGTRKTRCIEIKTAVMYWLLCLFPVKTCGLKRLSPSQLFFFVFLKRCHALEAEVSRCAYTRYQGHTF